MSANFCQSAVAASLQLGRRGAGIKSLSGTEVATRNAADTALVTLEVATPTAAAHATTKAYVDSLLNGLVWKNPARAVATSNIATLSGTAVIDGVSLAAGDRVLLTAQTTATENGAWEVQTGAWTRPADFPTGGSAQANAFFITEGTANADTAWVCTTDKPNDIIDTNNLAFVQFASVTAGVTTIADAVAVPAGGSSLITSGTGPTATLNVLDDSPRISISLAASVITLDLVALSVTSTYLAANSVITAKIADDAVTVAKIEPNGTTAVVRGQITFTDAGTTVTIGTLPTNARVIRTEVDVTTLFDDATMTVDVQINSVSYQGTAESDLNIAGLYQCEDSNVENAGAVAIDAVVSTSSTVTQGVANILVYYNVYA